MPVPFSIFSTLACLTLVLGAIARADDAPDPVLRAEISKAFRPQILRDTKDPTLVEVMIQFDRPPADMAFDAALQSGSETWPVGPMAWKKGGIGWWAYDVDLPVEIKTVDVVLTPSEKARDQLLHDDNAFRLGGLQAFWTGDPITRSSVPVNTQEIGMIAIRPQLESGHENPLDLADANDPAVQVALAGNRAAARAQLQQRATAQPDDRPTLFNLACVTAADGDLDGALEQLATLRHDGLPPDLTPRVQRLFRMIAGMNLYRAEQKQDPAAMRALGEAYENGYGVAQLPDEAKHWYRDAANAGNAAAMCRLAAMYEHEIGATVQTDEAHAWYQKESAQWYRKAADLGNEEAKQWIASHASP
jgi:hypothetical protein